MLVPATAPDGANVIDTDTKLTDAMLDAICAATWEDRHVAAIGRYVGLQQNGAGDIDHDELERIVGHGLGCWLIQHVRYPGWAPTQQLGVADGQAARRNAELVGYPHGCNLVLDLEGVRPGTPDEQVADYCDAWANAVIDAFGSTLYVGYAAVLGPSQLYARPNFHSYARDIGPRSVTNRGFQWVQTAEDIVLEGVKVDLGRVMQDALGGNLVWCAAGPADRITEPELPTAQLPQDRQVDDLAQRRLFDLPQAHRMPQRGQVWTCGAYSDPSLPKVLATALRAVNFCVGPSFGRSPGWPRKSGRSSGCTRSQ